MAYWSPGGNNSGRSGGIAVKTYIWEACVNSKQQNKNRPDVTPARAQEQEERKKRLAEALRENLRKRKSQQRKQAQSGGSDTAD